MSQNKKLFIQTLGCQMNDTDSQHIQADGCNVYFREVKYGLADDEYMYEVHAL